MRSKPTPPKPKRGAHHERLQAFLGIWHAEGKSYGPASDGATEPWVSDETVEWITGEFFILQKWDANHLSKRFAGVGIIGYDEEAGHYITRCFENHGFYREYNTTADGNVWTFTGDTERARIEFIDPDTQIIHWEWRPDGKDWTPLCDRVSRRKGL